MFKQFISLSLSFLLIVSAVPLEALTHILAPTLNSPAEQSYDITHSFFDGKSKKPRSSASVGKFAVTSDFGDLNDCFNSGSNCPKPPKPVPRPSKDSSSSSSSNTPRPVREKTSVQARQPTPNCGPLQYIRGLDNHECALENCQNYNDCDPKVLTQEEIDKINQEKTKSYQIWRKIEQERQQAYNELSLAGKFGYWTSLFLIPAVLAAGVYFGALALGAMSKTAFITTTLGSIFGLGLSIGSYFSPSPSFHETLGNALLAPIELPYGVFSGLVSFITLGHKNLPDLQLSSFLSQFHRTAKRASEAIALASSGALGLGTAGIPVLSAGVGVLGFPISLGLGLLAAANTLYRGGPVAWKKLVAEPYRKEKELKLAQEKELKGLTRQASDLDAQTKGLTQEIKRSPLGKWLDSDRRFNSDMKIAIEPPGDKPGDWLPTERHLPWARQLKEYRQAVWEQLKNYKNLIDQAQREEKDLRNLMASFERLVKEASWLEPRLRQYFRVGLPRIESDLKRSDSPQEHLSSIKIWKGAIEGRIKELEDLEKAAQASKSPPSLLERLWERKQYLQKEAVDAQSQNLAWQEFHKQFGSNPWPSLANQSQTIEDNDLFKNLDLRYLVANGPFDENKEPILGQMRIPEDLQAIQNKLPNDSDWRPLQTLPLIIPAKLEPRWTKDNLLIGAFGWTRDDGNTFHSGVDIKASWGIERPDLPGDQQKGFGVPVGLRTEVKIIDIVHEDWRSNKKTGELKPTGYGNYVLAQDAQTPNTFYVLGHAGEDADFNPKSNEWLKSESKIKSKAGVLVNEGDTIPAFRPIMLLGHSGNAATSNPKDGTADTHVHLEKHVVPDEAVVTWAEGKKVKRQYSMTFAQLREKLQQAMRNESVTIKGYGALQSNEAVDFLQARLRKLIFTPKCDTDGDGRKEHCYARNPLE